MSVGSFNGGFVADYANATKAVAAVGSRPGGIALSGKGELWVTRPDTDSVTVFAADGKELRTVTEGIHHPTVAAADTAGNVYVANKNAVTVYAPAGETPLRTIVNRDGSTEALFVSATGTYVAERSGSGKSAKYAVLEYAPGGIRLMRTIPLRDSAVTAMTSDAQDTLYVVLAKSSGVHLFAAASTTQTGRIENGAPSPTALATGPDGNVDVANADGKVAVFSPGASSPSGEFQASGEIAAMSWDPRGSLYLATPGRIETFALGGVRPWATVEVARVSTLVASSSGAFAAIDPNAAMLYSTVRPSEVLRITQGISKPVDIFFDKTGNRYVVNHQQGVSIYAPGQSTPLRTVAVSDTHCATIDAEGNLYIGYEDKVGVFAPGQTTPQRTITDGVKYPIRLTLDSAENLYVANLPASTVTVYARGGSSLIRTLTTGVFRPYVLAFDSAGMLYVGSHNNIQVYANGAEPPIRRITDNVDGPISFSFDVYGNLFSVNAGGRKSISEYEAHSTKLLRAIGGVTYPQQVAVDDSGIMFVTDAAGSVNVYSAGTGKLLFNWGLPDPAALAIPGSNR